MQLRGLSVPEFRECQLEGWSLSSVGEARSPPPVVKEHPLAVKASADALGSIQGPHPGSSGLEPWGC